MDPWVLRAVHVLAAALLVGVPSAMAFGARGARTAEWVSWSALAALVLGGVANLGALGGVPPITTGWGRILLLKLGVLLVLLVVSAVRLGRTLVGAPAPRLWAASAALAAVALVLAVVLAHG